MDFYRIKERSTKNGVLEVYPDFRVTRSKDLMVRGKSFFAIWDEAKGLWSTDEYDVQRLVDEDLLRHKKDLESRNQGVIQVKYMSDFNSASWKTFRNYLSHLSDSSHDLDQVLTYSVVDEHDNVLPTKKTDYASRRLPYYLKHEPIDEYNEIMSTLYSPDERAKLEWAIGAVISGDAKNMQKFLVLYGPGGTGKSTILNIIQMLFEGYTTSFDAKSLTGNNNSFATEAFRHNPLVAIQHDGDLSKIEDNTKLNSIVSHEDMTINEKYKPSYTARINAFLFMGTNKPVKITDAKSGIIRRLIDVQPTGNLIPSGRYGTLMDQLDFRLGGIAQHCLDTYTEMGKNYYAHYRPIEMMLQTDVFFNFIEYYIDIFMEQEGVTLNQAYSMHKEYSEDSGLDFKMPRYRFREELKNYFRTFEERAVVDGERVRSWYSDFDKEKFTTIKAVEKPASLVLDQVDSIFDEMCEDEPAQYAGANETPSKFWSKDERMMTNPKTGTRELMVPPDNLVVSTKLSDIDTTKLHYVKPPVNHIVIDFDLTDEKGEKSAEMNIAAASSWLPTYAEYSKGGGGVHLHYIYEGDTALLSRVFSEGIEIKVFNGNSSLRRRLTKCNNIPVATISSGLPLIKEKKVINNETLKSEKSLRELILRNLKKEIHHSTKPSIDFIDKILTDAYSSGLAYDVTDLRSKIMAFANNSSNNAMYCLKVTQGLKYKSEVSAETVVATKDDRIVFYDIEVFPNLLVINWKYHGTPGVVRMINPSPVEVDALMKMKLVGYNCRRYDNHILYARSMGYDNEQLYKLSKKIIDNVPGAHFGEAYNISYADIYDFATKKQSLKLWQVELGIHHKELGLPWDEPVPEEKWNLVAEYCDNDVISTEVVFDHLESDFVARQILADISGLSVNTPNNSHSAKIVFSGNKKTQDSLVYTDLSKEFPGYKYDMGTSTYKGEVTGEGGYIFAEPGIHHNVVLMDIASMHPTTIENLNLFGPYTTNFSQIKQARVAIKHKDYDKAGKMLGGILAKHLTDPKAAKDLSNALKLVINSVYGLTSAKFDNPFRDRRNKDNIVAKRGALFMIDLKEFVQSKGFTVVHIKTDSIKIADATDEIVDLVTEFGKNYGYDFEKEHVYEKMVLLNDAVYAAKIQWSPNPWEIGTWTSTGTQLIEPYVFKKLFSHENVEFRDLCKTFTVKTSLYLDFDAEKDNAMALEESTPHFVGKVGSFTPIKPGHGGALLLREKDGKYHAATGTKGYFWLESHMVSEMDREGDIDYSYFDRLVDKAVESIGKFGDVEAFLN